MCSPSGKGVCVKDLYESPVCVCEPGFSGNHCEVKDCPSSENDLECNGHGVCAHSMCFCNPSWSGGACEHEAICLNDCSGKGLCANGECFCNSGYAGHNCSLSLYHLSLLLSLLFSYSFSLSLSLSLSQVMIALYLPMN